jgi:hypothetical protein
MPFSIFLKLNLLDFVVEKYCGLASTYYFPIPFILKIFLNSILLDTTRNDLMWAIVWNILCNYTREPTSSVYYARHSPYRQLRDPSLYL